MRLLTEFYSTPWALHLPVYLQMQMVIERWAAGVKLTAPEISAAIEPKAARPGPMQAQGGVFVLPIYGILTHRAIDAQSVSTSLTSTEMLASVFRSAMNDPSISQIVLDVNSPGGSVFGVQELGDLIRSARGQKPITAVANNTAASGAYWLAAQADRLIVTPSGMVGSVGVVLPHVDASKAYEAQGVKVTYVTAGKYKTEGNNTAPLDPEAQAYMQEMVDSYYSAFVSAVAKGRGVGVDVVRGEAYGQGRMRLAKDAVANGMADAVDTLDNVIASMTKRKQMSSASAHAQMAAL